MKFDLVFMTGRKDPHLEWVLDALTHQARAEDEITLIIVDALAAFDIKRTPESIGFFPHPMIDQVIHTAPKPNLWQGKHRVTSREWWATSNSRNTAIVYAETDYVVFLDDRCTPGPRWLDTVRKGYTDKQSVLAGSYDKIEGAVDARRVAQDHRRELFPRGKINCGGGWLYGCTFALPLAWALEVNGFEEGCDGLTGEDYIFGLMLERNGRRIDFAPDLFVHQDRTPGNESCKGSYACRDKGVSPNDKSHAALARFGKRKRTEFTPDLRALREIVRRGEPLPIPDPSADHRDWYDGQLVRDMEMA